MLIPGDIVWVVRSDFEGYRTDKAWRGHVGRIIPKDISGSNIEPFFKEDNLPRWLVSASEVEHLTALEAEVLHARQQSPQASQE